MTRYVFDAIQTSRTKKGVCVKCGKRRQKTKRFTETINPFNKNANGTPKTRDQVQESVIEKARVWMSEPLVCTGCE